MTVTQWCINSLRKHAAIIVSLFCVLALYIFISVGFRSVLGPVLGGTIGGITAIIVLYTHGSIIQDTEARTRTPPDYRVPVIVTCLYASSIVIMYRFVSYDRPLVHYLVFGAFAGYIAYEIATGVRRTRVVPQILILSFFTYWSSQFAFPAGAYSPDVHGRALPAIREGLAQAQISADYSTYMGYFVYVAETSRLVDLSPEMTYYILATVVLVGSLLVLSVLDIALPRIPREVALYATLLFGCMSWTLGRGMWPNKLNFFYPLILLVGLVTLRLFASGDQLSRKRWLLIGTILSPALIFGHRFSAGAAMVFLGTIGIFIVLYYTLLEDEYAPQPRGLTLGFVGAYILAIVGNPLHSQPLLGRFTSLLLSILSPATASASGGPGRYSDFALEFLIANTAGQAMLFGLAIFGAALVIRRTAWEYDLVILWMGVLSVLLIGSLVVNARDFQPQRFYALLGLFGLNICAGATLLAANRITPRKIGPPILAIAVCFFAIASLASPIAGMALSPFNDEIPHIPKYETEQGIEGTEWVDSFTENPLSVVPPTSDIPTNRISPARVELVLNEVEPGQLYIYSNISAQSGIVVDDGRSIGGRNFAFVEPPNSVRDSTIYANGQTTAYITS